MGARPSGSRGRARAASGSAFKTSSLTSTRRCWTSNATRSRRSQRCCGVAWRRAPTLGLRPRPWHWPRRHRRPPRRLARRPPARLSLWRRPSPRARTTPRPLPSTPSTSRSCTTGRRPSRGSCARAATMATRAIRSATSPARCGASCSPRSLRSRPWTRTTRGGSRRCSTRTRRSRRACASSRPSSTASARSCCTSWPARTSSAPSSWRA
mmetsp:Transcript_25395/g.80768  ORF Transcript_25395/g.80768 Transcript_25395/m.80768 type:complete len:210 (-) Transcript_25395:284-913(-)